MIVRKPGTQPVSTAFLSDHTHRTLPDDPCYIKANRDQPAQVRSGSRPCYRTKIRFRKGLLSLAWTISFVFGLLLASLGQNLVTTVSAAKIGKNQYVEVQYEIAGSSRIDDFKAPAFSDWIVLSGPSNSSYQSNINGQVSRKTAISYYLQPRRTGRLQVEGAAAVVDGKTLKSSAKTVEVVEKDVSNPANSSGIQQADPFGNLLNDPFFAQPPAVPAAPQQQEEVFADAMVLRPGESVPEKIRNNLFIRVIPSKTTCYEGEAIMAVYKVYTRLDMDASVTRRPSFSGFSAIDMEEPNQPYVLETVNGKKYKSWVIRKVQLYPLQSGVLSLEPVEVDCTIRFIRAEKLNSGNYNPYSQDLYNKVQYTLKSPAVNVMAEALPTVGRPAGFSGAVGHFTIQASIKNNQALAKEEAAHLIIDINGSGNFSMVHAPNVSWPAHTEAYEPKEMEQLDQSTLPVSGSKLFDYAFVPHQQGELKIPAVSFSYFDTENKTYKTVSTQALVLQVAKQRPVSGVFTSSPGNPGWPVVFSRVAAIVLPLLAVGLLVMLLISFRRKKEPARVATATDTLPDTDATVPPAATVSQPPAHTSSHEAYMPSGAEQPVPAVPDHQQATAQTSEPASVPHQTHPAPALQAETLIWLEDHRLFYKALKNDVLQSLATIAGNPSLHKNALLDALAGKEADLVVVQQLNALIDECDAALYSPVRSGADRQKMLEEAKFLLGKL